MHELSSIRYVVFIYINFFQTKFNNVLVFTAFNVTSSFISDKKKLEIIFISQTVRFRVNFLP